MTLIIISIYLLIFQIALFFMSENAINAFKQKRYWEFFVCSILVLAAEVISFILIMSEFFPQLQALEILK